MGITKTLASLVLAGVAALGLAGKLKAEDKWVVIDNPWASGTFASDIYDNKVVGDWGSSAAQGFSYDISTDSWNVLNKPGFTSYSQVDAIDAGRIGGRYMAGSVTHGFIYENDNWTILDMPGMSATEVHDIDGINILGAGWQDRWHGFLYDEDKEGDKWSTIDKPGAGDTQPMGISGNKIVGVYNGIIGFLYDGTNWTDLNMPGADSTLATAIDGNNIVGFYNDSHGKMHGFRYDLAREIWKSIDAPNATKRTAVVGINGNELVGYYEDASGYHGFIYTPEPATLSLLAAGGLGLAGVRRKR